MIVAVILTLFCRSSSSRNWSNRRQKKRKRRRWRKQRRQKNRRRHLRTNELATSAIGPAYLCGPTAEIRYYSFAVGGEVSDHGSALRWTMEFQAPSLVAWNA